METPLVKSRVLSANPARRSSQVAIVAFGIACEISKQCTNFAAVYFSDDGRYPVPQTAIVLAIEVVKVVMVVGILALRGGFPEVSRGRVWYSLPFMVPGICYAANNNLYLYSLTMVAPPIWTILTSLRTPVTTLVYKHLLGREVTRSQLVGATLMVTSICVAKAGDLASGYQSVPQEAICLAAIVSVISVGASIFTEVQLKGNKHCEMSFLEKQFWLNFYCSIVALIGHLGHDSTYLLQHFIKDFSETKRIVQLSIVGGILSSSLFGLAVAGILRSLDNVVKEYSASIANIGTAVLCSYIFPDAFELTKYILLSLVALCTGIYLYESGRTSRAKESLVIPG